MTEYVKGQRVRVITEGTVHHCANGVLHVTGHDPQRPDSIASFILDAVTVEHLAPEHWPPRPGDLWRCGGGLLWFAIEHHCADGCEDEVDMIDQLGNKWAEDLDALLTGRHPWTRLHSGDDGEQEER